MRLAVVTVNYCCGEAIVAHLRGTASEIASCGGEWWIVDNDSPDKSAQMIKAEIAGIRNAHLMMAERNGGFGYGNNQLINKVLSGEIDADYIYMLNPDATPEPGAIETMLSYLEEHETVGVVGSGLIDEHGAHTDSMFRFPSLWSEIDSALVFGPVSRLLRNHRQSLGCLEEPTAVDWVAGTSFMVRADVFRAVGGFDEDFFLYWEEVELCHRIKRAGFLIHGLPSAKVRHIGGISTGMHRLDRRVPAYWHRSRNLYFRKTGSGGPLSALNFATGCALALGRCLQFVKRAPARYPRFLTDHVKYALEAQRHGSKVKRSGA